MAGEHAAATWWNRWGRTTVLLLVFFASALFIRSYFNYEASYNDGDWRWSGTDGYYHMRVIDHIRETGGFLLRDEGINYPVGATNPRPPIFDWTVAAVGGMLAPFFGGDAKASTDTVAGFSPALWAAFTIFPIYFLGKEAFGRRAGLWAAFFIAVMASNITRSNLGSMDHDSAILFFFVLGAFFFTRALRRMSRAVYVEDYRRTGAIGSGLSRFIRENRVSVLHAALTGGAFAGIALTWQGYPYVWAVFAVWFGFQLLANHLRHQDSTGHFVLMVVAMVTSLLMISPYYYQVGRFDSWVMPTVYIFVGMLVASLIFVPTRHLPPVLVIPTVLAAGLVAVLLMIFAFPDIGDLFFSGLGYFVQTKLYSTIAEAQRTPLGYLVFATGVIPFFFALAGIFMAIASFVKKRRDDHLFVLVWAAVGLLMAFTATRFVYNASVGFAVLAGWVTQRFIDWVRFGDVSKSWRGVRGAGYNLAKSVRSSVGLRHVLASIFIVFILLLPNVWLGVDAGVPQEYISERARDADRDEIEFWQTYFGAFGQDFLSVHWQDALGYLSEQDQDIDDLADRPAFIAWWDYGFYAVNKGDHPTVADPFQFGYQIAGTFLASQDESEAIGLMAIRLLEGNAHHSGRPGAFSSDVEAALEAESPGLTDKLYSKARGQQYRQAYDVLKQELGEDGELSDERASEFYRAIRVATDKSIGYFTLDGRMFPCDDPRSRGIDSGSIFYAPVFLADKNPEDFVKTRYDGPGGERYFQKIYDTDENGVSFQVETPHVIDQFGKRYILSGGQLLPMAKNGYIDYSDPLSATPPSITSEQLEYTDLFYNTLLYRAWVGPEPTTREDQVPPSDMWAPGHGLKHFRLVYTTSRVAENDAAANRCFDTSTGSTTGYTVGVTILKYYDGAPVSGVVRNDQGEPMSGAVVQVVDNFGIMHDTAVTDGNGTFALLAPFSTEDDPSERAAGSSRLGLRGTGPNRIEVIVNGEVASNQTFSVTEDQANGLGAAIPPFDLTVELGSIQGVVFDDVDGDGEFNASNDTVVPGALAQVGTQNVTTGDDGRYLLDGVAPGSRTVQVTASGFDAANPRVSVPPGGQATLDVPLTASPLDVLGVVRTENGTALEGAAVRFEKPLVQGGEQDEVTSDPTNEDGNYTVSVPRGDWDVSVNYTTIENSQNVRYFTEQPIRVELRTGDPPLELDIEVRREVVE